MRHNDNPPSLASRPPSSSQRLMLNPPNTFTLVIADLQNAGFSVNYWLTCFLNLLETWHGDYPEFEKRNSQRVWRTEVSRRVHRQSICRESVSQKLVIFWMNNITQWRPYRWCKWCGAPGPRTLGAHQRGPDSNFFWKLTLSTQQNPVPMTSFIKAQRHLLLRRPTLMSSMIASRHSSCHSVHCLRTI